MRLNKPRRKHVGWGSARQSQPGRDFVEIVLALLGDFEDIPVTKIRDVHVFAAHGEHGDALILETQGIQSEDNSWLSYLAVRTWSDPHFQAVLTLRRWDPWLEFGEEAVRAASRGQRKEWHYELLRRAWHSDEVISERGVAGDLFGVTSAELDLCWLQSFDGAPPGRPLLDDLERARDERFASRSLLEMKSSSGVTIYVDVRLLKNGDIEVSIEQLGTGATAIGSSYEAWWIIRREKRQAFLDTIGVDPNDPIGGIVDKYSGEVGWERLERLLEAHKDEFNLGFHSWMSSD